jgi:hypothetical protein
MSGNDIINIDTINIYQTCGKPAKLLYVDYELPGDNGIPHLVLKFGHEFTDSSEPEWNCEAQSESCGYIVKIPLATWDLYKLYEKDPKMISYWELLKKQDGNKIPTISAEWY